MDFVFNLLKYFTNFMHLEFELRKKNQMSSTNIRILLQVGHLVLIYWRVMQSRGHTKSLDI